MPLFVLESNAFLKYLTTIPQIYLSKVSVSVKISPSVSVLTFYLFESEFKQGPHTTFSKLISEALLVK